MNNQTKQFVTAKELASLLSKNVITIYRQTNGGKIPFVELPSGRKLYDPVLVPKKITDPSPKALIPRKRIRYSATTKTPDFSRIRAEIQEGIRSLLLFP